MMSKTTVKQVRMKGELVISNYWTIPTEETGMGEEGGEVDSVINISDGEEKQNPAPKEDIVPTKPTKWWNDLQELRKGKQIQTPWFENAQQPIGAPIAGMPKKGKGMGFPNQPGSSGDKKGGNTEKTTETSKKRDREGKEWEWYPTGSKQKVGQQKGNKGPMKGGGKGKNEMEEFLHIEEEEEEEEEEEDDEWEEVEVGDDDEEEDRFGYILKNGRRVKWDFLLDQEIKLKYVPTTPKPPPPRLRTVLAEEPEEEDEKEEEQRVNLTKVEMERIMELMKKEDEGKGGYGKNVKKLNPTKYGCMGG